MTIPMMLAAAVWQTWPFNGVRTLPGTVRPANAREEVTVVTARGAPAVFAAAIRSDRAATDVKPSAGTVKSAEGATFDAGAATVRWVKCEACDPNAWFSGEPGIGEKTLVPLRLVSGAAVVLALGAVYFFMGEEAKKHFVHRVTTNSARGFRWPAYWGPNFDWRPDQCHGGNVQNIIQSMLLQFEGRKIFLAPAWTKDWNCSFKLHAPYQTTLEGRIENGQIKDLVVTPASRRADVVLCL